MPFTDTETAPLLGLEEGVTVQSKVRLLVFVIVCPDKSADLPHPAGTVNTAPTFVQLPPETLNTKWTLNGCETFIVLSVAPDGELILKPVMLICRFASVNVFCAWRPDTLPTAVK